MFLPFPPFAGAFRRDALQSPAQQGWAGLSGGWIKIPSLADGVTCCFWRCVSLVPQSRVSSQPWLWLMARLCQKGCTDFWSPSESSAFIFNALISGISGKAFYRQHPAWNHMLDNTKPEDTLWVRVSLTHRKEEKGCCRVSKFSVLQLGDEAGPDPSDYTHQFITCF